MLLRDIAQLLKARLEGNDDLQVDRLVHPDRAETATDLALAMSGDAVPALARTKARAAVISADAPVPARAFDALLTVTEPRMTLAKLTALFDPGPVREAGVHPTAVVAADAELGEGVAIGPFAVVGPRTRIGARTVVLPHVTIGADAVIGADGLFHSGVRIGDRVTIGDRAIIHANAVIGSDGFSFAPEMNSPAAFAPGVILTRVHALGTVTIGDDVEIGACTTIDRSTLEDTRIGRGVKIDNHVHIGHNVVIGESSIVCGMAGISGSVTIGERVRLAGGVGIGDHLKIGDQAIVAAGSGVSGNVAPGAFVSGYPALPHERSVEHFYYLSRQKRLHRKVDEISARLEAVERSIKDDGG
ncbi:MAG TPA: UDP-3-O-(3-hydroxymyristoyl)glucosamine N-acyltransferase [Pseudolabrys sp.]|nr:UDP-3-O-(3-hydroxymyristoyl)glucosamine N-acyltransferase [Pseudolabrys sp.]